MTPLVAPPFWYIGKFRAKYYSPLKEPQTFEDGFLSKKWGFCYENRLKSVNFVKLHTFRLHEEMPVDLKHNVTGRKCAGSVV
jgi:hypothetical protein